MKFIGNINKVKITKDVEIKIPIYHRTGISFHNDAEIYYFTRKFTSGRFQVRELIMSPIRPDLWNRIRKITIFAHDFPGIMNAITSKMKDLCINVNVEEALSTEKDAILTVSLIVDLSEYLIRHQYNITGKLPREVNDIIKSEIRSIKNGAESIVVDESKIQITELAYLEDVCLNSGDLQQFGECPHQTVLNNKGTVAISDEIIKSLALSKSEQFYTIFSDTEEKYIRIVFFDKAQRLASICVHHYDRFGAISKITEVISNSNKPIESRFNIIASYSHQQMTRERAHWYGIIDISNGEETFFEKTLDMLRAAKYNDHDTNKNVENVFLVETNAIIDEDVVRRFGQNKKTMDGEITSVFEQKRELLIRLLQRAKIYNYKKYLTQKDEFKNMNGLQDVDSIDNTIRNIFDEKSKTIIKKVIKKSILFAFGVIVLVILYFLAASGFLGAYVHEKITDILVACGYLLVIVVFVLILKIVDKNNEKWSNKIFHLFKSKK